MIENQIAVDLALLDTTPTFLSGLAGFTQTKVSQGLSGVRRLTNTELVTLISDLSGCKQLRDLAAPLPIAFKNPAVIRALLDQLRDGTLRICVDSQQVTPDKPPAFSIRWRDGRWFSRRKENGEVVLSMNPIGVTAVNSATADALLRLLADAGFECTKVLMSHAGDVVTLDTIWPGAMPVEKAK